MTTNQKTMSLDEQKAQNKFMFQFISCKDGRRSEPFLTSWDGLQNTVKQIKKQEDCDINDDDLILLVAVIDGKDTHIPATPLIKVSTFMKMQPSKGAKNDE